MNMVKRFSAYKPPFILIQCVFDLAFVDLQLSKKQHKGRASNGFSFTISAVDVPTI